jgi:hypothetical protein
MGCICVLNVEVPLCAETVTVDTDLGSGTYKSVITDKFGQEYHRDVTVYGGQFEVDLTDYPEGLVTAYSTLVLDLFDGCESQIITNCEKEYTQLVFTFVANDSEETNITVCCP